MLKHCVYLLDSTFGVHLFNIPQKLDHSNKKNRGFAHTPKKMLTISTIEKVKAPKDMPNTDFYQSTNLIPTLPI